MMIHKDLENLLEKPNESAYFQILNASNTA